MVQLRPVPLTDAGTPLDSDWVITTVDDTRVELRAPDGSTTAVLGTDHIYSFVTNPARDTPSTRHGFLQLLVQVLVLPDRVYVEPIAPPKTPGFDALAHFRRFDPLVVQDNGKLRYFSWRGRDPLHLIDKEELPRQLLTFASPLCDVLRRESGVEPQFQRPCKDSRRNRV